METERAFDLICLGRAAVDLYGEQVGTELEEVQSFAKSLGGCAANIAVGSARQGLRVSMLTRVGAEPMGRFVARALQREGVDTSKVQVDQNRLTGLVLLSVQSPTQFPLTFYRERCADMAISLEGFDPEYIASAKVLLLTGTHFSSPEMAKVSLTAARWARQHGTKVALDIDYRPVLWELVQPSEGATSFVASDRVADILGEVLPMCDLIVGTEDEVRVIGRSSEVSRSLAFLRERTEAVLVLKLGERGCTIYPASIGDDAAIHCPPRPVEIYNVLGAGDAFMSGFLRGWLEEETWLRCGRLGNGAGALVVGRRDCSPAMPTRHELEAFIAKRSDRISSVEEDPQLVRLHRVTLRAAPPSDLLVLAFDHRSYFERLFQHANDEEQQVKLKWLIAQGGLSTIEAADQSRFGFIIDGGAGRQALQALSHLTDVWLARPIEIPDYRPLAFEGGLENVDARLRIWPCGQVVKCLVQFHPDGNPSLQAIQIRRLLWLQDACIRLARSLLLEVIPMRSALPSPDIAVVPRAVEKLYEAGLYPEWWKLPCLSNQEDWAAVDAVIEANDSRCSGVLMLGLDAAAESLIDAFAQARVGCSRLRGFAVGRTIFGDPAERWLRRELSDDGLIEQVSKRYHALVQGWDKATPPASGARTS